MLDRPLPAIVRIALLIVCALLPSAYVGMVYERHHDLTRILYFGELFQDCALPEIREIKPVIMPGPGFDGQFYAQIALDPALLRPDLLPALDNPPLRAQRILLPTLAHLLGLGRPQAEIAAYALLNLAFWFLLFFFLIRQLPANTPRHLLVLFAILWNSGTLASVQNALTDLPACTLGLISLYLGECSAAILISLAILTKPTGGLFLLRYAAPFPQTGRAWAKKTGLVLLALILPACWQLYLFHVLKTGPGESGLLALPFEGWWHQLLAGSRALAESSAPWTSENALQRVISLFEFLALASLTVQAVFLLLRPRPDLALWLVGLAFAFLFLCLSAKVLSSQVGYVRTVLPMTMAFNLLLLEIKSPRFFLLLFIAGNIGLLEGVGEMVLYTWFPSAIGD